MRLRLLAALVFSSVSQAGYGQPTGDPTAQVKSCLKSEGPARQECVDRLWRELTEDSAVAPAISVDGTWVLSETMSPVDYSTQIIARKVFSSTADNAPSSLTIACRGLRIEVSVGTTGIWRSSSSDEFKVAYRLNDQPEIQDRWAASVGGRSAVFRGDAAKFLEAMPHAGRMRIRVHDWEGPAHEATFQLTGLDAVRQKIGAACKPGAASFATSPTWR